MSQQTQQVTPARQKTPDRARTHLVHTNGGGKANGVGHRNGALVDARPDLDSLQAEILHGLQQPVKTLPTKLLYDQRGSELFDEITELDDYYPSRTEIAIMRDSIDAIAEEIGSQAMLIEYGSGSSTKTPILLDNLSDLAAYVPIDISAEHLATAANRLHATYPTLEILPVTADYMQAIDLPTSQVRPNRRVVYFPGSTIGNFHPAEALAFLRRVATVCGPHGRLLIGVDLKKDPVLLHCAYNDSEGVTAAFNLNILTHLNREFDTDFQVDQFRHYAYYNAPKGRIEMHLVNLVEQQIQWLDREILLRQGESIWTESSYKYTIDEFTDLVTHAGFRSVTHWVDDDELFSVHLLERV